MNRTTASVKTKVATGHDLSIIRYTRDNVWDVSGKLYTSLFSSFALYRVTISDAKKAIKRGQMLRKGVLYNVIYHNCDSAKLGKSHFLSVMLSFRTPIAISNLSPVVLLSVSMKEVT